VKVGETPGFGHRAIRVAPELNCVSWQGFRLQLAITCDAEHVHAVAWTAGPRPVARVARTLQDGTSAAPAAAWSKPEEGEAARRIARELVAEVIGCSPEDLAVVRDPAPGAWDGYGPPRIVRGRAHVDADVSLSHDGPFAAAAALARPAWRLP
jgi:hypothetical protein